MADYTSVAAVLALVPMVGSVTSVMSADIVTFINAAESIVNAKVSKAYTVPVTPAPPLLETLTVDLTVYRLLSLRFFTQEQMNRSVWPDRFKESLAILNDIGAGKVPLLTGSGTVIESDKGAAAMSSSTLNYQQTFTEDDPERSFVDTDKITAIRAVR